MSLFSERFSEAMNLRNIRQRDIANNTGISKAKINQYVHGKYTPRYATALKISESLNVNVGWLMGYNVPMEDKQNNSTQNTDIDNYNAGVNENVEQPNGSSKECNYCFYEFIDNVRDINLSPGELNDLLEYAKYLVFRRK